jgi:hypothetical protein
MKRKLIIPLMTLMLIGQLAHTQVLISLLFGDKLNSPTLKFGLDGGVNFSSLSNVSPSKYYTGFNLGFYFDILLKKEKNWYIHTGVLVKSPLGVDGLTPYSLNNEAMDSLFQNGSVSRQLRYFNVPVLVRYKFKCQMFVELGPVFSILYKANDVFKADIKDKEDLTYNNKILDKCNRMDVGGEAGIGYHLIKGTGVNLGIRYYYGFVDLIKNNPDKSQLNSSFYLYASIPIGAGEKGQANKAAAAKKRQEKRERKLAEKKQKAENRQKEQ